MGISRQVFQRDIHHSLTNAPKLFRKHIYDRHDNVMEEIDMKSAHATSNWGLPTRLT